HSPAPGWGDSQQSPRRVRPTSGLGAQACRPCCGRRRRALSPPIVGEQLQRRRHAALGRGNTPTCKEGTMDSRTSVWKARLAVLVGIGMLGGALVSAADHPDNGPGAVFVMTNSVDRDRGGNHVVMYARDPDGELTLVGAFPTGDLAQ